MKVSLRWLQEYITLNCPPAEMLERLTMGGTEVESQQTLGVTDPHIVVAEVVSYVPHPNADRLRLCQVSIGTETKQIVCGAKNFEAGSRVALALPGAVLPGDFRIKESKLRGELSQGMMCSAKELGLDEEAEGLLILSSETKLGEKLSDAIPADLWFEIEVTPNRPDLLSYQGLAIELAALNCGTLRPQPAPNLAWPTTAPEWSVNREELAKCPYYTATILTGVKVEPSPAWLQERIRATGHRPINNVVDITNFVLWEMGQPLHAFDAALLAGSTLKIRAAQAGEKILALDGATYTLTPADLVIADGEKPQAIAGVMGGQESGVSERTTTIVLESAWFTPGAVRATARRLGLSSDSSYRFERRTNPEGVLVARDRAIALLQEITGAKLVAAPLVVGSPPPGRDPITLRSTRVEQVLGVSWSDAEIQETLLKLGLSPQAGQWVPPASRYDLAGEIDLIEELARVRGLAQFPSRLHTGWSKASNVDMAYDRVVTLRQTLSARGWQECLTEAIVDGSLLGETAALELRNPLTAQYTHLRPDLIRTLLPVAAGNWAQGNHQLRLFEVGRCYQAVDGQVVESMRLGLLLAGQEGELSWAQPERAVDFFDLRGEVSALGLPAEAISRQGLVESSLLKTYGLKVPVYYAEFVLDGWLASAPANSSYVPLPSFPAVRRDVALIVERTIPHEQVQRVMQAQKMAALERVELFDVFQDDSGEKIPRAKKSLAYALTYRASDRTLTDKEVNAWHEQLLAKLQAELGCELRGS